MPFPNAAQRRLKRLYHWQRFDEGRLEAILAENLLPLIAKSEMWKYENEYRLVAQDTANATGHETLLATNGFLKLPAGALQSVIVGCQGSYDVVQNLVRKCNPGFPVLHARKVDNRYALEITP